MIATPVSAAPQQQMKHAIGKNQGAQKGRGGCQAHVMVSQCIHTSNCGILSASRLTPPMPIVVI